MEPFTDFCFSQWLYRIETTACASPFHFMSREDLQGGYFALFADPSRAISFSAIVGYQDTHDVKNRRFMRGLRIKLEETTLQGLSREAWQLG